MQAKDDDRKGVSNMLTQKKLKKIIDEARVIDIDENSKIVIMSDIHRGDGSPADNFLKNKNTFLVALEHYDRENYTYIELGDADELWENKDINEIIDTYSDVFRLLVRLYCDDRYISVYGNHDMVKANPQWVTENLTTYCRTFDNKCVNVFPGLQVHEAVILNRRDTKEKILLLHGHQVDTISSTFWRLSRFMVRHLWRPVEVLGINNPMSSAKNNKLRMLVDERLTAAAQESGYKIVAGHTHQSVFPEGKGHWYYNDGSCVHIRCITAIEIDHGQMRLVKWCIKADEAGRLHIGRDILAGDGKKELVM